MRKKLIPVLITAALTFTILFYLLDFSLWLERHNALWVLFASWFAVAFAVLGVPFIKGVREGMREATGQSEEQ